ncbi:hypothetical protein QRB38_19845 [Mycobacterium avium subsp. hominissuis]|uniref:hypothetical protein n=1 Tax=Mycobacterium TaxID=1763 RepID=UPI0002A5708B|nr:MULTISPECIES: hypothetical protein [Mycobacterium]AGB27370.1 hypothetical protein Mycsm_07278 [Mycobacterium sp. JS623]MDO2396029.1 hypothetical protein [Mycobacterium avium subsp. hominissuis]
MNPSEQYRSAAAELTELAAALEGGRTDADTALGITIRVLQQLAEVEPQRGTAEAIHGLGERLQSGGTINPDKLREIAATQHRVAQSHDDLANQMRGLWS